MPETTFQDTTIQDTELIEDESSLSEPEGDVAQEPDDDVMQVIEDVPRVPAKAISQRIDEDLQQGTEEDVQHVPDEDVHQGIEDDAPQAISGDDAVDTATSISADDTTAERLGAEDVNILRRRMKPHDPREKLYARHRYWMSQQQREYPQPMTRYRVAPYIRYYNQTEHPDYLKYHMQKYRDDIALCPKWTLVDFYVDYGANPPRMESAPGLCRLLTDCFNGKVDLIVTQNISFMSKRPDELIFISRLLAAQDPPVGIYFIGEDVFTLASYFRHDMFEELEWEVLENDELDEGMLYVPKRKALAAGEREKMISAEVLAIASTSDTAVDKGVWSNGDASGRT